MKTNIRRLLCVLLAAVMLSSFAGCSSEDPDIPDGFTLASNEYCDFDFIVPETWTVSMSQGTVAAYATLDDPSSVSVMPGELKNTDTTLDDWWKSYKSDLEDIYSNVTYVSEEDATLGGVTGKCYTFTATLGEDSDETEETGDTADKKTVYRFEITAVIKYSRIYMMTFTSTEDKYQNHTRTLTDIKEHFKFH